MPYIPPSVVQEVKRMDLLTYLKNYEPYLPISFEGINRPNEDGTVTELDGLAAIEYKRGLYEASSGEVTPDRIKTALETYQNCVQEYGSVEEEGFPLEINIENQWLTQTDAPYLWSFLLCRFIFSLFIPHDIL